MTIRAAASPGELRVAALGADGRLLDYGLDRAGGGPALGDVYRGRVTARVPAMAGAFVEIGATLAGFLPDSAGAAALREGDHAKLRIVRAPQGGKGARVAVLTVPCDAGPPGRVERGPGALGRLALLHAEAPIVLDDAMLYTDLRRALGDRVTLVRSAFDDEIEGAIDALAEQAVPLDNGGRLRIEPTSALVAIDVDIGGGAATRAGKTAAHVAANTAAVAEVARQIRLRSLGGPIVVDLAGLSPRRRATLAPAFADTLAADPAGARFLGFSALGLAEIVRARGDAPLWEKLASPHGAALAALRALVRAVAASPARPPRLWAAPDVASALSDDVPAALAVTRSCGRPAVVTVTHELSPRHWSLDPP